MAVTAKWFRAGLQKVATGSVDLDTDTFKLLLTTSAYTPDYDVHDFRDDVTNEVTGTGYTAGGVTMSGVSVSVAAGVVKIDWTTDPAWASSTITARRAVLYKSRGGAASADELVAAIDFGADFSSTAGPFTITLDANGLLNLTN